MFSGPLTEPVSPTAWKTSWPDLAIALTAASPAFPSTCASLSTGSTPPRGVVKGDRTDLMLGVQRVDRLEGGVVRRVLDAEAGRIGGRFGLPEHWSRDWGR